MWGKEVINAKTPMDNLLNAIEEHCVTLREKEFGIFEAVFNHEMARTLIKDFQDGRLVGRST